MGCDMVVAVGPATVDGHTLFGHNCSRPAPAGQPLCRVPGRAFAAGENVRTDFVELPQARQTYTILGSQPPGCWGFRHGVNEHGVAAGCASYRNKLRAERPSLTGTDLVRLVLERSRNARQALDLLTNLLERHGQGFFAGCPAEHDGDQAFLLADPEEAWLLETAAQHWACQEIREVRAAGNLCTIRQDWNRISPGLSGHAIEQGWWPGDGSKLDFAGALGDSPSGAASALRRWGRATFLLEQQNGHIDGGFLRKLLGDHYEGTYFEVDPLVALKGPVPLCQHANGPKGAATAASLAARLGHDPERLPWIGCAFGPPCLSAYFPIFLEGELPSAFTPAGAELPDGDMAARMARLYARLRTHPKLWHEAHDRFATLQADFDQDAEEFAAEGASLKARGEHDTLRHLAGAFMQHHLERFDAVLESLGSRERPGVLKLSSGARS